MKESHVNPVAMKGAVSFWGEFPVARRLAI